MATNKAGKSTVKTFATLFTEDAFQWGEAEDLAVRIIDGKVQWTEAVSEADLPLPSKVLDGVEYSSLVGTLGKIDENDINISNTIRDNALALIAHYLTTFRKLDYIHDLSMNEGKGNIKRYGILIGDLASFEDATSAQTMNRSYTVVMIDKYGTKGKNGKLREESADLLRSKMEEMRRRFGETNFGSFANVMGVNNYSEAAITYDDEQSIVTCTMTLDVLYNVNNK